MSDDDRPDLRHLRMQATSFVYQLPADRPSALLVLQLTRELLDWVDKTDEPAAPGRVVRLVRSSPDEPPPRRDPSHIPSRKGRLRAAFCFVKEKARRIGHTGPSPSPAANLNQEAQRTSNQEAQRLTGEQAQLGPTAQPGQSGLMRTGARLPRPRRYIRGRERGIAPPPI